MKDDMPRIFKIGDALSQLANVALLPNHADTCANESISGRAYRNGWRVQKVINWIFFWQDDHCKQAYLYDLERAKAYIARH